MPPSRPEIPESSIPPAIIAETNQPSQQNASQLAVKQAGKMQASQHQQSMSSFQQIKIPADILVGYKIFPGSKFITSQAQLGQSEADWSGLYAQFSLQHAVAYLPNHFDRGNESAMLVAIRSKRPVKCVLYCDKSFSDTAVSSDTKATALRTAIATCLPPETQIQASGIPLLQSVGTFLDSFVVMYDEEDLECAFPHCFLSDDNFNFEVLAVFERDPVHPWMAKSVAVRPPDIDQQRTPLADDSDRLQFVNVALTTDDRADMRLLALKLENFVSPVSCTWVERYAPQKILN